MLRIAVKLFLTHKQFSFNPRTQWPAICVSSMEGHASVVHLLVTLGPRKSNFNINARDRFGYAAVHGASEGGFAGVLEDVLSVDEIEPNIEVGGRGEAAGKTALLFAVENSHTDCTRLLLSHPKVDPNHPENVETLSFSFNFLSDAFYYFPPFSESSRI